MPIQAWTETKSYDPINDRRAIRITGFSGHGAFWIDQPLTPPGKSRRAQREHLLNLIEAAIERGDTPGEVAYQDPAMDRPEHSIFDPTQY